jgi:hypothetical protein
VAYLGDGSGKKLFLRASSIGVCIDFVAGQDVGCLQIMDNMQASFVFYVKVGTFIHLEQSTISLLTVNKSEIVKLSVQYAIIVSVSSM